MKYILRKPVRDLVKDDFLKLHLAEDDKLLTISFDEEVDGLGSLPYIEEVKQLYIRVSYMYIIIYNRKNTQKFTKNILFYRMNSVLTYNNGMMYDANVLI